MTYTLTLKLKTEIYQGHRIDKSFDVAVRIYNSLLSHELKKLKSLENNETYKTLIDKKYKTREDYNLLKSLREDFGFSVFQFNNDIKNIRKHYGHNMQSQVGQKLAKRLSASFDKYFYGNGKAVSYKKKGTIHSLEGASNYNGIIFTNNKVLYLNMSIPVIIPKDEYIQNALKGKICYVRIMRKMGKKKYQYYIQLIIDGKTLKKERPINKGRVGIDIGTSTIATVSDYDVHIEELAKDIKDYGKELKQINRKIERSKRKLNPDNFNEDGTIKKGKHKWIISNHCKKLYQKREYLNQKVSNKRKYLYEVMANEILSQGDEIIVETMDFKALQRIKKATEKDEQGRYKKKKRFGKSIAKHAPAMMISIIERKAPIYNARIIKVDKFKYKASQYNHLTGEYKKRSLKQRKILIGENEYQRDLYSAFLLKCYKTTTEIDHLLCQNEFMRFIELHDTEIERLKKQKNISSIGY